MEFAFSTLILKKIEYFKNLVNSCFLIALTLMENPLCLPGFMSCEMGWPSSPHLDYGSGAVFFFELNCGKPIIVLISKRKWQIIKPTCICRKKFLVDLNFFKVRYSLKNSKFQLRIKVSLDVLQIKIHPPLLFCLEGRKQFNKFMVKQIFSIDQSLEGINHS
jgi:hypothetical protein